MDIWPTGRNGNAASREIDSRTAMAVKTESLIYTEQTERGPSCRSIACIMDLMDGRYGRTDSERSCDWLSALTDFKRETLENYKD